MAASTWSIRAFHVLGHFLSQYFGERPFSVQEAVEALRDHIDNPSSQERYPALLALDPTVLVTDFDSLLRANRIRSLTTRFGSVLTKADNRLLEVDRLKLRIERGKWNKFRQPYRILDETPKGASPEAAAPASGPASTPGPRNHPRRIATPPTFSKTTFPAPDRGHTFAHDWDSQSITAPCTACGLSKTQIGNPGSWPGPGPVDYR